MTPASSHITNTTDSELSQLGPWHQDRRHRYSIRAGEDNESSDILDVDHDVFPRPLEPPLVSEVVTHDDVDWDPEPVSESSAETISIDDMRSVDSLGDGRGDREHSFSSPLTKIAAPAQANKDGCIQLLHSYIELQPHQVPDFAFPEECRTWLDVAEEQDRTTELAACACKPDGHASVRGDHRGGCSLDTEDGELSRNPAAVPAVTAPCDSHGHHAYAYRQTHRGRELASGPLLERDGTCMMDTWSEQSGIEVPFDLEESSYEPYTCEAGFTVFGDRYVDEALRPFVLDRTTLILDSLHPEIAPHIVITAPPDPWEGSLARAWNSPLPQDGSLLTIPLQYIAPEYSPSYGLIEYYGQPSRYESHSFPVRPSLRPSRFTISTEEDDELSFSLLRLYKMAARTAMLLAPSFRKRWDTPSFAQAQEIPFTWSDPGAPLLEFYGSCRDTRIIDSVHPFSAPHIIIHEAPDPMPWEACVNRVVMPQHCWYLMVPGTPCHCPPSVTEDVPSLDVSIHIEEVEDCQEEYSMRPLDLLVDVDVVSAVDGDVEELALLSPSDESDSNSEFWPDTPKGDVFRFTVSIDPPLSDLPPEPSLSHTCYKAGNEFVLEEDEDDLPPFDDWYQDIAQRTAG